MHSSRLILAGLAAVLLIGLWQSPPAAVRKSPPGGDIILFRAVVERMRGGESYYAAMNAELRARSYPTASVVNWRLPATFMIVAKAPRATHLLMLTLGAAGLALSVLLFRNAPPALTIAASLIMLGAAFLPAIPTDGLYMPETWAGILLLLSVLAYSFGAVKFGVGCAIAAACCRELAVPYALAALGMAAYAGRRTEVRWYLGGLSIFVTYYATHAWLAHRYILPSDYGYSTWVTYNGWPFAVSTVGMGGWYLLLPFWAAGIGAVIILASLWSRADLRLKIVVALYFAAFCFIGHSFNAYWGLMTGPTWGLATVYGLTGLHRLARES